MTNILVYIEDVEYCKNIVNNLSMSNENIRICCILNKIEELNLINDIHTIDIYIFFIDNICNNKLLDTIKNFPYFDSLILIFKNKNLFQNGKIQYIFKNKDINSDIKLLNNIIKQKKNKLYIKSKIERELIILGYKSFYIGTRYLVDAIYLLYTYNTPNIVLEKDIYPIIAQKYNKSVNNIKCNIINATNIMYYDCDEKKLDNYLKTPFKPSPKKVISMVTYYLRRSN